MNHNSKLEPPTTANELIRLIEGSGGELRIHNPPSEVRAGWRRAISALIAGTVLPDGFCVRHSGRDHGDLVIRIVPIDRQPRAALDVAKLAMPKNLHGCLPMIQSTQSAAKKDGSGWIDTRRTANVVHLRVHSANLGRSLLLVQALANEAVRRGYHVGARSGYQCDGGLHIFIGDDAFEITIREETHRVAHMLSTSELRDQKRGRYIYAPKWDFQLTGRLQIRDNHYSSYGAPLASDRQRWKIEDRLQNVFARLEEKSVNANLRRVQVHEQQLIAEARQRSNLDEAISKYEMICRAQWLSIQLAARREAKEYLEFVAEARNHIGLSDEDHEWLDWVERHAIEIDPLKKSLAPPPTPELSFDDLAPFLESHSPEWPPFLH